MKKNRIYTRIQDHVPIAEFVLLRTGRNNVPVLWVVEAKSSSPRPETRPNFNDFVLEIREKLVNAFSLGFASCMKRHPQAEDELPKAFQNVDLSQAEVKFVLVIKDHKDE